ncbi:hypothetical protein [Spirosoma migulaei]
MADSYAKGHRFIPSTLYAPGEEANETNGFTLAPYANRKNSIPSARRLCSNQRAG